MLSPTHKLLGWRASLIAFKKRRNRVRPLRCALNASNGRQTSTQNLTDFCTKLVAACPFVFVSVTCGTCGVMSIMGWRLLLLATPVLAYYGNDYDEPCPSTCYGNTCDYWIQYYGYTCEDAYSWSCDCEGCESCASPPPPPY